MTLNAIRPAALFGTASMATLLALFFNWRGRMVRRMRSSRSTPNDIDDALADSFPASDPPAWTPGVARLTPQAAGRTARRSIPERPHVHVAR